MLRLSFTALALLVASGSAWSQAVLRSEPAMGALREGQRVLVDNGSCPAGQILEVIGGNHVEAGGRLQIRRVRRCIAHAAGSTATVSRKEKAPPAKSLSRREAVPSPRSAAADAEAPTSPSDGR